MKKLILSLAFSTFLMLSLVSINNVSAIAANAACGTEASCSVGTAATNDAIAGVCDAGLVCASNTAANGCTCQKPFGAGLKGQGAMSALSTTTTVPGIIGSVIKVILGISGTVALIFIIWGGIQWMISKGDEKKITDARKLMTSGMVGIFIIAAAYAITDFVIKQITVVAGVN